jgi:hypothetical protein
VENTRGIATAGKLAQTNVVTIVVVDDDDDDDDDKNILWR